MARQNDNALYPHGKFFIRRKPGAPKLWQVVDGTFSGFGKARTFTETRILMDDIPKGRIAREEAEKLGSGPQLSKKDREATEALAPAPMALTEVVNETGDTMEAPPPPAEHLEGSYFKELQKRFKEQRRAAGGGDEDFE